MNAQIALLSYLADNYLEAGQIQLALTRLLESILLSHRTGLY